MAVNKQYITDISSTFSDVDADRIDRLVVVLGDQVPASKWGDRRDLGLAYLVMHTIQLDKQGGNGMVTKKRVRDIEQTYDAPRNVKSDPNGYHLTVWGQQFMELRKLLVRTTPMVTGGLC